MSIARFPFRFLWLTLLLFSQGLVAADLATLLERVGTAYGGRQQLATATAFEQYGTTVSAMHRQPGRIHRAFQYPDRLRIDVRYGEDDRELRVLSGASAWQQGTPVTGARYDAMLLQAARLGLPGTLLDHRDRVSDGGFITARDGSRLRALELPFHGGLRLIAGVDPDTGRIVESRGIMATAAEHDLEFATVYSDFRTVGGRLFAFEETHYAMAGVVGQTRLDHVEVVQQLPEELFDGTLPDRPGPDQHLARR
ncbi:MAG: hypothetical protein R3F42_07055 [Pseudomonadota bacterium]